MKINLAKTLILVSAVLIYSCSKEDDLPDTPTAVVTTLSIVDKNATAEKKALFANLWTIQKIAPMFGHQDYRAY